MNSKVLQVAWRDFKQTVLRKAFLIAILGIPLLLVVVGAVAALIIIGHEEPPLVGTVVIVEPSGEVAEAAREEFGADALRREREEQLRQLQEDAADSLRTGGLGTPQDLSTVLSRGEIRITIENVAEAALDRLRERVRTGELLAAAVVEPPALAVPSDEQEGGAGFDLYVGEDVDSDHTSMIERRLGQAVVRVRAARAGYDYDQAKALLQRPTPDTQRVLASGEVASESAGLREARQIIPMVFMMLLWIATFTSGQHLMMSTIEEKSNRVMEVLLSAVSPLQLMTGKIIGQGGVGLLIVVIYSSLGVGALILFALLHLIEMIDLLYLGVYFFMAYFMIASIMAAVGSAVSDIREANTLMTPVMLVLMVPLMLWMPITHDPNGAVATTFSFLPPAIPFAMILRVCADEPVPFWQIPVTIAWGYLCVLGMIWMA
ncbi:MAG: ABC transporter permease, partial [Planctomycetota bacterium]